MAAEGETQVELKSHETSYASFAWMMKWGTIVSFVVAMFVVLIISS